MPASTTPQHGHRRRMAAPASGRTLLLGWLVTTWAQAATVDRAPSWCGPWQISCSAGRRQSGLDSEDPAAAGLAVVRSRLDAPVRGPLERFPARHGEPHPR
jgi:hypothetical protein